MKKRLLHIAALAIVMCGIISSCHKDAAKVIPRGKLARIYAEMLVVDQWIISTPGVRVTADTSLVYEPIFHKYGYTSDDYRKSIDVYMDDPERFARILRTTGEILQERMKELEMQQKLLDIKANLPKLKYDIDWDEFYPYIFEEPYIHYYDSVAFEPDSILQIYRLKSIERADTIYDRLRMVILDTLSVKDSIVQADTLLHADTLMVGDSIGQFSAIELPDSIIQHTLSVSETDPKSAAGKSRVLNRALGRIPGDRKIKE